MDAKITNNENSAKLRGKIKELPAIDPTLSKWGHAADAGAVGRALLEFAYPIGAVYMSTLSTNPSELFGGTWESVPNDFSVHMWTRVA